MTGGPGDAAALRARAGLCGGCRHALLRPTRRGTTYLRCALSAVDPRFPKYPGLPVTECTGFMPGDEPAEPRK